MINKLAEEVLLETYLNNPTLRYVDRELMLTASDPKVTRGQLTETVQHCLGRHLTPTIFELLDWEYLTDIWYYNEDAILGRANPKQEDL